MFSEQEKEILFEVKQLLSDPEKWTTGTFAEDLNNKTVSPRGTDACKWCLMGAVDKICCEKQHDRLIAYNTINSIKFKLETVAGKIDKLFLDVPVTTINDKYGRENILKILDVALQN